MYLILYLSLFVNIVVADLFDDPPYYDIEKAEELYNEFIETHGKTYQNEEEKQIRFDIFKENLNIINEKNAEGGAVFKINHLADLSQEEFALTYLGYKPLLENHTCVVKYNVEVIEKAPEILNWAEKGVVTRIKNQEKCGSCWAFATVANIESQYKLKNGILNEFSEMELVDCSNSNNGCDGGEMATALTDIMDLGGLELESDYPYNLTKNYIKNCRFNKSKVATDIKGCTLYYLDNEEDIKYVLLQKGPLIVSINAFHLPFWNTKVLRKSQCPDIVSEKRDMLHAVLLVGYGTDSEGVDYWLLKNSWGENFGEHGYFRISRRENTCGIMNVTYRETGRIQRMYVATAEL